MATTTIVRHATRAAAATGSPVSAGEGLATIDHIQLNGSIGVRGGSDGGGPAGTVAGGLGLVPSEQKTLGQLLEAQEGPESSMELAKRKALRGGVSGAVAQGVNVLALMWLRTTMNVQMVNGGSMTSTIASLYRQGGVPRFYRGLAPALVQGPLSRFGDTFANAGVLAVMESHESTRDLPIVLKTSAASVGAGVMRIGLMPIDAYKTIAQVHGNGLKGIAAKIRSYPNPGLRNLWGFGALWHGGLAQASATAVGHWPWFATYNYLDETMPYGSKDREASTMQKVGRNAFIGLSASTVSSVAANSLRVLKTYRQTSEAPIGYMEAARAIVKRDGLFTRQGLFFRGLETRLLASGLNSMVFTVAWKAFQEASER